MVANTDFKPNDTASSVIVAYTENPNGSKVMVVGKKDIEKGMKIINAFQDDKAQMIWNMLTGGTKE